MAGTKSIIVVCGLLLFCLASVGGQEAIHTNSFEPEGDLLNGSEETVTLKRDISGGGFCNSTADCGGSSQGSCVNSSCVCTKGYANYNCQYSRKSRLTAFLLAILVGTTGAERFYLGYIGDGVGKILLMVFGFVFCLGGAITSGVSSACFSGGTPLKISGGIGLCCGLCVLLIGFLCILASEIWWLVDWIIILEKNLDDNDGYALEDDF